MFKHISAVTAFIVLALLTSGTAQANPSAIDGGSTQGKLWVTSGFFSKHLSTDHAPKRGYNETNSGIGVEYVVNDNWRIAGGTYKNSVYRDSRYLQAVWSPDATSINFTGGRLALGVAAGLIDGYPMLNHGKVSPALLPVASLEYKLVGVNLTYIPTVGSNIDGAVALQFKVKFF